MAKEITFQNGEGVVLVKINANGEAELVKETTANITKRDVAMESALNQGIPLSVQEEVDEYLQLHEQMAELKAKQDKLKKSIRGFMEDNSKTSLQGSRGKQVYLQDTKATNSTSRYTDYELKDIMKVLYGTPLLREVTEVRVNADKLEGLLKTARLPMNKVKQIEAMKICRPGTPQFRVKK